jgi:hypothetical protein
MCGCKDCKEVTLFKGTDGRGIVSITANEDGTFTYLFTDGTIYISPDLTGPEGPAGENGVNGLTQIAYITDPLGPDTSGNDPIYLPLSPFTYTVPALTPTANYEITFNATIILTFTEVNYHRVFADFAKNSNSLDPINNIYRRGVTAVTVGYLPLAFNVTTTAIVSLAAGDVIEVYSSSTEPNDAYLYGGVFKIYKLA